MPFVCSICGEAATQICVRCTKDACANHICEKCLRCSDCCECELALQPPAPVPVVRSMSAPHHAAAPSPEVRPEPAAPAEERSAEEPGLG